MTNLKSQIKEIEEFYNQAQGQNPRSQVHILKTRMTFINTFNGLMIDPDWYKKVRESQDVINKRVMEARAKNNRLRDAAKPIDPSDQRLLERDPNNAYDQYDARPIGGG